MFANQNTKSKLIYSSLFFIISSILLTILITFYYGNKSSKQNIEDILNNSQSIQKEFIAQRLKQLELVSLLVASEPAFVSYVAQAIDSYETENSISYLTSISDLLLERKQQFEFDLAIITNTKGKQLARSDLPMSVFKNLSNKPLLNQSMQKLSAVNGYWYENEKLFQASVIPLVRGQGLIGFMITGNLVNNQFANQIARLSATDVVIYAIKNNELSLIGSSLSVGYSGEFIKKLKEFIADKSIDLKQKNTLQVNGKNLSINSNTLGLFLDGSQASLVSIVSNEKILAPYVKSRYMILLLGIILSFLAVWVILISAKKLFKDIKNVELSLKGLSKSSTNVINNISVSQELVGVNHEITTLHQDLKGKASLAQHMVEMSKKIPESPDYFWIGDIDAIIKPNQTIGSRFKILRKIGAGGMGMVFQAIDTELKEVVALKVLIKNKYHDVQISQLKDEIKFARKIHDPNVVRIYDFGKIGGHVFITMEYIMGYTLGQMIKQFNKLNHSAAKYASLQICYGLRAAHQAGIIHRDLKPDNLIVELDTTVKLMDFGIASTQNNVSKNQVSQYVEGTIAYTSPEQLQGKGADERSDIYALGVIIMELFVGVKPFENSDDEQLMLAKVSQNPQVISDFWVNAPTKLEKVILKCIQLNPVDRYQNLDVLIADLKAIDI